MSKTTIQQADLTQVEHQNALLALLDTYAFDDAGEPEKLPADVRQRVIAGLSQHPTHVSFLAWTDNQPVGLAVTFGGFSTFKGRPLVNIHDLVVEPSSRGTGVGSLLLKAVEGYAQSIGCCKLTLEVQSDNFGAQRL